MTMTMKRITHVQLTESTNGNWTPGVVKHVAVCGTKSRNGYTYRESALQKVLPQYDNMEIYLDHQGKVTKSRTVSEHFATIRKPYWDNGTKTVKVEEFAYRQEHPFAKQFEEQLRRNEKWFRLSHVADGDVVQTPSGKVVESVSKIHGVDLVTNAATTQSLFESVLIEEDMPTPAGEETPEAPAGESSTPNIDAAILEGAAADCAAILADAGMDRAAKLAAFEVILDKMEGVVELEDTGESEGSTPTSEQVKALVSQVKTLTEQVQSLTKKPKKYIGKKEVVSEQLHSSPVINYGIDVDNVQSMRDFWSTN